ncbi:type II toxin-antitoxin system RelE/ParE family toxin [Chryseobacterium taklimakanense]|uniref:type II toxin-antitoxin system RelE/ParE family toxin n=1 Tax=Chryseobacterium taklimakanense TaxID=536441 RepID=UPI000F5F0E20|nr:type II toxin-antitoxin system RelE/ParE family toxin [Chryseobacterium taklimakanense]
MEIEYLSENPKSGQDFSQIRKGNFRSRVKSHFIFYRINLKSDELEIIRILHLKNSKNFIKHFPPAKFKTKNSASTTELLFKKSGFKNVPAESLLLPDRFQRDLILPRAL